MSYIDTIKHKVVGEFNGLPLYLPTEVIKREPVFKSNGDIYKNNPDFSCSPRTLVLGGGSGEHSAIVISNFSLLLIKYIDWVLNFENIKNNNFQDLLDDLCYEHIFNSDEERLDFVDWTFSEYLSFGTTKEAKSIEKLKMNSIEEWIEIAIGECIFFHIGEFNLNVNIELKDIYNQIQMHLQDYQLSYLFKRKRLITF